MKSPIKTRLDFRKAVLTQARQMERYLKAFRKKRCLPSGVHKMRVSTRRLREAFAFLKEAVDEERSQKLADRTKKLTKALGLCRSLDVGLGILRKEFKRRDPLVVDFIIQCMSKERALHERQLLRIIEEFKERSFRKELKRILKDLDSRHDRRWEKAGLKILQRRKRDLLSGINVKDARLGQKMHNIRVDLKKLRYDLEFQRYFMRDTSSSKLRIIKGLQGRLGRWHDYETLRMHLEQMTHRMRSQTEDVWANRLKIFTKKVKALEDKAQNLILRTLKEKIARVIQ